MENSPRRTCNADMVVDRWVTPPAGRTLANHLSRSSTA
jgi:hypothetical protein